jgi:hypothetical protein
VYATPDRTVEQRREALDHANEIRTKRADWKRALKVGRADPAWVILAPAPELVTMKVFDVLLAVPKVGRVKANKIMIRARISPAKTLGGLSERQRAELVALMERS